MTAGKKELETFGENEMIISGNLSIRKAKKADPGYFNKICKEAREILSEVKSNLSDDIIIDRKE